MGNRAVITTSRQDIGIYLHWNGGRDSVEAFLKYCELKGYRAPSQDNYGWARLCQVIGNFFGGGCSVGIGPYSNLDTDNGDNGVYIIDGWEIVGRKYFSGEEQHEYDLNEMLEEIDSRMPASEQLGKGFITGQRVKPDELKVGDEVYVVDYKGAISIEKVIGIGGDRWVNGTNVKGIPYVMRYSVMEPESNINNYLQEESYVIHEK